MAAEENKKSFWEIFAIVVGAIAAVLGGLSGVAALITALKEPPKPEAAPTAQAAPAKTPPPAVDDTAQRAAVEEIKRAKAELVRLKAEAAAARAEAERQKAAEPKQGDTITDDVTGMKLAYVPGGCFNMGSPPEEKDRDDDEGPVHEVCVDSFWMGQYEVTQGQWQKIMGSNPAKFQKGGNYPVERVSWDDVQEFIKKLNSNTGKNYCLPTEAEWEYACRANGSGKYCGSDDVDAVAWYYKNSGDSTHPVGGKDANAFGLHDISGNVWEWCADWYDSGYYASSPQSNPVGPDRGSSRVIRGGSWGSTPGSVRTAFRDRLAPGFRDNGLGFRLVLPGQQGQAGR